MPAGYTRQDTTGALANGNPIDADLFNNEYNAIESSMNASSGHNHDGTTGGGATINKVGPSNELEVDSSAIFPKVNNLVDNGKTGLRWKDGYFAGNLTTDDLSLSGEVKTNLIPDTDDTRDLGSSSKKWKDIHISGTLAADKPITQTQTDLNATGGTLAIDFALSNHFKIAISAATTFSFSNLTVGQYGHIIIVQNGTGGYSFTLPTAAKTPVNGATIVQSTGANEISVIGYYIMSSTQVLVNYIGDFA